MKRVTVFLMAVLALSFVANVAGASQIHDVSVKVSYADLNIDNEAGARTLYSRLQSAASQVCETGSYAKLRSLSAWTHARACYEETLDKAVAEIDQEQLTRIHES